jgi:hypothetical protein
LDTLRKEVTLLESEKKKIIAQQQHKPITASSNPVDIKLKKELKEKTLLLESKLLLLRQKENECTKLSVQRQKSAQELSSLQQQLQESKHHKVELMKKMKEDAALQAQLRRQQMTVDAQARRKEIITEIKLAKLEKELVTKEIILREQKQKAATLTAKHSSAQSKQLMPAGFTVKDKVAFTSTSPPHQQAVEEIVDHELQRQIKLQSLRTQLSKTINDRTHVAKQVASLKLATARQLSEANQTESISPAMSLQAAELEAQLKAYSSEVASIQSDIASCEETKLSNLFSSIRESRAVVGVLFAKLIQSQTLPAPIDSAIGSNSTKRKINVHGSDSAVAHPSTKKLMTEIISRPALQPDKHSDSLRKPGFVGGSMHMRTQNVIKPTVTFTAGNNSGKTRVPLHVPKGTSASMNSTGRNPVVLPRCNAKLDQRKQLSSAMLPKAPSGVAISQNINSRLDKMTAAATALNALTVTLLDTAKLIVPTESSDAKPDNVQERDEDTENSDSTENDEDYDDLNESDCSEYDELDESFYPDEEDNGGGGDEDDSDDESVYRPRRRTHRRNLAVQKLQPTEDDATTVSNRSSVSSITSSHTNNSNSSNTSPSGCNGRGSGDDSDDDETDFSVNDDDLSEFSDSYAKKSNKRAKQAKKTSDELTTKPSKKKPRVAFKDEETVLESVDLLGIIAHKPLHKHTVPELKALLRNCGCTVQGKHLTYSPLGAIVDVLSFFSGVKDELIRKLENQIELQRCAISDSSCELMTATDN